MPIHGLDFQSSRDHVVGFTEAELKSRIELFADETRSDDDTRMRFFPGRRRSRKYPRGDTRQWSLPTAREYLRENEHWRDSTRRCLYRPFDNRYILYDSHMVDWPRPAVMGHMLSENLCLVANRQSKEPFAVLCASDLTERKIAAVYDAST